MEFNLHGLEASLLCENANDAIVEIEVTDEVLVLGLTAKRETKS